MKLFRFSSGAFILIMALSTPALSMASLARVQAIVAASTPDPALAAGKPASPSPTPSPPPFIRFGVPTPTKSKATPVVIYVLGASDGIAADQPTLSKLISAVAERVQRYELDQNAWIVPQPTWGLQDYLTQCNVDGQHTLGALVVGLDSTANSVASTFFTEKAFTDLTAHAIYIQCSTIDAKSPQETAVWASPSVDGYGAVSSLTLAAPIALGLSAFSLAANFIPQKTQSVATVRTFPSPNPGGTSTITTTIGSTFAPGGAGGNALTAATTLSGLTAFSGDTTKVSPSSDRQTWRAVAEAADILEFQINCPVSRRITSPYNMSKESRKKTDHDPGPTVIAPFCKVGQGKDPTKP